MLHDPSGNPVIKQIQYIDVTPTVLNADAYDSGDVLFDTTQIADACQSINQPAVLQSLVILDEDDQTAAAWVLWFLRANVTFGTKDAAPSISDANSRNITGYVAVASTDFLDVGGAKVACLKNIGLVLPPVTDTRDIYVAATVTGTPTQTTGGIKLRFGFLNF
jgi:hypothetical protein